MDTDLAKQKALPHDILRMTVKYKSHTPDARYIVPGAEQVSFEHLSDDDYRLMIKKGLIAPAKKAGK